MTRDIRWKQRFQNFDRAVVLLREPLQRGIEIRIAAGDAVEFTGGVEPEEV